MAAQSFIQINLPDQIVWHADWILEVIKSMRVEYCRQPSDVTRWKLRPIIDGLIALTRREACCEKKVT